MTEKAVRRPKGYYEPTLWTQVKDRVWCWWQYSGTTEYVKGEAICRFRDKYGNSFEARRTR